MKIKVRHVAGGAVVLLLVALLVFTCGGFFIGCEPFWEDEDDSEEDDVVSVEEPEPEPTIWEDEDDSEEDDVVSVEEPEPEPTIWHSGARNVYIGMGPPPPAEVYFRWELDVNNDSVADYSFYASQIGDLTVTAQSNNRFAGPLTQGDSIGTESQWTQGAQLMAAWREQLGGQQGCAGPWCGASNAYMGLEFAIDGRTHYGWVKITVSSPGGYALIYDWAYETRAGVGIKAGQK